MIYSIQSLRYEMEPLRTIAAADIPAAYQVYAFNPNDPMTPATGAGYLSVPSTAPNHANQAPLLYPARQYIIRNETNVDLYYSLNGIDDHDMIVSTTGFVNDVSSNKTATQKGYSSFSVPAGTVFYVRYFGGVAPAAGGYVTLAVSFGGE